MRNDSLKRVNKRWLFHHFLVQYPLHQEEAGIAAGLKVPAPVRSSFSKPLQKKKNRNRRTVEVVVFDHGAKPYRIFAVKHRTLVVVFGLYS